MTGLGLGNLIGGTDNHIIEGYRAGIGSLEGPGAVVVLRKVGDGSTRLSGSSDGFHGPAIWYVTGSSEVHSEIEELGLITLRTSNGLRHHERLVLAVVGLLGVGVCESRGRNLLASVIRRGSSAILHELDIADPLCSVSVVSVADGSNQRVSLGIIDHASGATSGLGNLPSVNTSMRKSRKNNAVGRSRLRFIGSCGQSSGSDGRIAILSRRHGCGCISGVLVQLNGGCRKGKLLGDRGTRICLELLRNTIIHSVLSRSTKRRNGAQRHDQGQTGCDGAHALLSKFHSNHPSNSLLATYYLYIHDLRSSSSLRSCAS